MPFHRTMLVCLVLLLGGCQGSSSSDDERKAAVADYNAASKKWEALNLDTYQYTVRFVCFCLVSDAYAAPGEYVAMVRNGVVTSAFAADTGEYLTDQQAANLPTVAKIFQAIDTALQRDADELEASYDETYGYPRKVYIDFSTRTADEEVRYEAKDLM